MDTEEIQESQEDTKEQEEKTEYHYEIKRKNAATGKWAKVGDISGLEDCGKAIESEYGPGIYKISVKNEDGDDVPGWKPFTITVEQSGINTTDKKSLGNYMEGLQQKIQEGIEIQNLVNAQKALGQQQPQEQDTEQIASMVAEKINRNSMPPESNEGNLKFMMWLQQQQNNLVTSLIKKDETPVIVESMKAMQDQNNKFFALFVEAMKPKESKIEKILVSLLESGFITEIISSLRPKETAWEKIVPMLLEKTTESVVANMENTMRMVQEQSKAHPPIDYDKKMQSNLYLIKEIGGVATKTIKDLAGVFFSNKISMPAQQVLQPQPLQPQPIKENPNAEKQIKQHKAEQPKAEQPKVENTEEDKAARIQREFSLAQKILADNKDKQILDIAKIFMSEVPVIAYILSSNPKEEILKQIEPSISQDLLPIVSSLIDFLQKKEV